jgi:hypothetical protein
MHQHLKYLRQQEHHMTRVDSHVRTRNGYIGCMLSHSPAVLQLYEVVFAHRASLIRKDKPIFLIT